MEIADLVPFGANGRGGNSHESTLGVEGRSSGVPACNFGVRLDHNSCLDPVEARNHSGGDGEGDALPQTTRPGVSGDPQGICDLRAACRSERSEGETQVQGQGLVLVALHQFEQGEVPLDVEFDDPGVEEFDRRSTGIEGDGDADGPFGGGSVRA